MRFNSQSIWDESMQHQKGFGLFHVIILLLIGIPLGVAVQHYFKKAEAEKMRLAEVARIEKTSKDLDAIGQIATEYRNAVQLASVTSRIALATPVQRIQDVHQRLKSKEVSGCAAISKVLLDAEMTLVEQAFISFMEGSDSVNKEISESMFRSAGQKKVAYSISVSECQKELVDEKARNTRS